MTADCLLQMIRVLFCKWLAKGDWRPKYYLNRMNTEVHVLSSAVLNTEINTPKIDSNRQLLKPLAGMGKIFCYDSLECVKDIGTPEHYEAVCRDFQNGTV